MHFFYKIDDNMIVNAFKLRRLIDTLDYCAMLLVCKVFVQ